MRKITVERLAEFTERDYQLAFGISKDEFDQMLAALEEAYAREHKRKPRFTKITIKDKLILYPDLPPRIPQHGQRCQRVRSFPRYHRR